MKRLNSVLLCLALICLAFAPFAYAADDLPFGDIPAGAYYQDAVKWAYESHITEGTSAGSFSPDKTCTRAQVVTFLWRSADCPEPV
ncbi:MAG: S-layer homology domain-containing protein, partial [Firmicutes bacterium]|nr:S-layer homology domain-containing protein [Bacillota bacterium]